MLNFSARRIARWTLELCCCWVVVHRHQSTSVIRRRQTFAVEKNMSWTPRLQQTLRAAEHWNPWKRTQIPPQGRNQTNQRVEEGKQAVSLCSSWMSRLWARASSTCKCQTQQTWGRERTWTWITLHIELDSIEFDDDLICKFSNFSIWIHYPVVSRGN